MGEERATAQDREDRGKSVERSCFGVSSVLGATLGLETSMDIQVATRIIGNITNYPLGANRAALGHSETTRRGVSAAAICLCAVLTLNFSSTPARAQSKTDEKPVLKPFGASLKRLKWDPAKREAVETESAKKDQEGASADVVRVNTDLVVCDVLIMDKQGRAVSGLTKDDLVLSEDGQPQQLSHFSLGNNDTIGRSIVLIFDHSGSLLPYINRSVEAARILIDQLGPKDRVAIVTNEVKLLVNFTSDKAKLKRTLESIKILAVSHRLNSFQFSALLATARELFDEEDVRPIIIFQTDGDQWMMLQPQDEHPVTFWQWRKLVVQFSLDDVCAALERSRATVYAVIPGFRLLDLPEAEQLKRAELDAQQVTIANGGGGDSQSRQPFHPSKKEIADNLDFRLKGQLAVAQVAKQSGGWTSFLEAPEQADAIYSSILADMNSRYVIGYYPGNKVRDGKRRQVSIHVRNHPEYAVWGRKSYLAPKD